MPYCPQCGDEFRPGFDWCPVCRVPLVDALPEPEPPQPLDPVPLRKVRDKSQLALVTGLLREAQIPFYTLDEGAGGYLQLVMGFSVYDQIIYVNRPDYEAASRCLAEYYDERTETCGMDPESVPSDPENDSYRGFLWFLAAFALLILLLRLL